MFRHAIAPLRRYTKASHDVVRHPRLSSDAKVLLLYVQGLPDDESGKALSEHALRLGIKGRAYQKAKEQLAGSGYLHEWRWQSDRGRWMTDQLLSNVTLTREEANVARCGAEVHRPPSGPNPAVGGSGGPRAGGQPTVVEEEREKNFPTPHPKSRRKSRPVTPKPPPPSGCCSRCGRSTGICTSAPERHAASPRPRPSGSGGVSRPLTCGEP